MSAGQVTILNTLGGALAHYTSALRHNLEAGGATCAVVSIDEPSISGEKSWRWVGQYLKALWSLRRFQGTVIVTWPVLGFLDIPIAGLILGSRVSVIVHDPQPLVDARGYGAVSRWLASKVTAPELIVHSEQATDAISPSALRRRAVRLAHPMHRPQSVRLGHDVEPYAVRVLGQYKPDRDLDALREISRASQGIALQIVGRRWPQVAGWAVRDEFVTETELSGLIQSSRAVVVPYRRFFQSGIAIRCLESGTAVVGPVGTSLDDLLGEASGALGDSGSWGSAVNWAISACGQDEALAAAGRWYEKAGQEWSEWISRRRGR